MEKCCAGTSQRMLVWPSLVANPENFQPFIRPPESPQGNHRAPLPTFPSPIQVKCSPPRLDFPLKWLCEEVAHRAGWDPGRPAGLVYKKRRTHGHMNANVSNIKRWSESRTSRIWERWKVHTAAPQIRFGVDPSDRLMGGFAHVPKQTHIPNHYCYC